MSVKIYKLKRTAQSTQPDHKFWDEVRTLSKRYGLELQREPGRIRFNRDAKASNSSPSGQRLVEVGGGDKSMSN